MRRENVPTLKSVAAEAEVSIMMASVVLNGARSSTRVSEQTRARILAAAARLGYRRNVAALGLSRRRMDTIGIAAVVDSSELNLYFLEVLNGILEGARDSGQNTTIFSLADWPKDEHRLLEFCDGRIDGMILIAPQLTPAVSASLSSLLPFVALHCNGTLPGGYCLEVENEKGAFDIVQHLIAQGHRRILHLSGGEHIRDAQQRTSGYCNALQASGISIDTSLIVHGNFSVFAGKRYMQAFLNQYPATGLPTAIFCASDALAYGCMEALSLHGLRVPEDISVVGFDDTLLARMTNPSLTTVRQPFREMGRCAVTRLLSLLNDGPLPGEASDAGVSADAASLARSRMELFDVGLVLRNSVGPPRSFLRSSASV